MKWFGRKAGGAAARPALARGFGAAFGAGEWPRSYEAQVRDAYVTNPIAQRAVRLVAESFGSAPMLCSRPDAARLIAAQSGGQGLLETVAAHLLLHGNAYVQLVRAAGSTDGGVVELYALRPDRVTVEADARGRLRWIDGSNGGLAAPIVAADGMTVTLAEPPPFAPVSGERVEISEGCDRRFATCRDRFANAPNFRGEPHLPGIDLLTRYPGE